MDSVSEKTEAKPLVQVAECGTKGDKGDNKCAKCAKCVDTSARKTDLAFYMGFFSLFLVFALICMAAGTMGVAAISVHDLKASHTTRVVARGLEEASSVSSSTDNACQIAGSSTTHPTPSAVSTTETVDGVTATGGVTVTPITSVVTANSSYTDTKTVTVFVTTYGSNDPVSGTPETSGTSSAAATTTGTGTDTITDTSTTTNYVTINSTGITTITVDAPTNSSATTVASLLHTWGSTGGMGTGGSFTMLPSTNGSLTYSVPAVSSSTTTGHPLATVVISSGAAGRRGSGHGVDSRDRNGSKGGFYCIVMAVACAVALAV
ncbi:hypothetical protein C8A00DRAFT_31224 [Chaetomidium leptoderma]|uniref:Uncharacterized protein n=1 Tax=Chaetomidium leptoderma TaxID=669021 RepID=A0AAN6VRA7_9PEZI|nr:hypothetical protein C8A00DRAFT_31224 [Chaetomidium leptoderma]